MFDGDENDRPALLEGDGLARVRSPHFIDVVGDDGSVVRLLLVAPDAMGASKPFSPSPGARGEGSSEPRQRAVAPIVCDSLRRESLTFRFPGGYDGPGSPDKGLSDRGDGRSQAAFP